MTLSTKLRGINPVLDRELRQRSRGARWMVLVSLFLLLALGVLYLTYYSQTYDDGYNYGYQDPIRALNLTVGRLMFEWVLMLQMTLLLFIVPGISAGSISGERDRQTLIPLQVTLVRPSGIFFGKVGSSTAFMSLLLVASVPLWAIAYILGGITITNVLLSLLTLLITGLLIAIVGVGSSALFQRSVASVLATYGVVMFMVIGTFIMWTIFAIGSSSDDYTFPFYLNPYGALSGAAGAPNYDGYEAWPLTGFRSWMEGDLYNFNGQQVNSSFDWFPVWVRGLLAQSVFAVIFGIAGMRRLVTPRDMVRT